MRGVHLFSEPWMDIFENHHALLAPMILLGTEPGWELLDGSADVKQATKEAYDSIADSVMLLFDHFALQRAAEMQQRLVQPGRPPVRVEAVRMPITSFKVGRNEACPCGSGLKFKKCCGAPPTVH